MAIDFGVSYEAFRAMSSGTHNLGNVVVSKDGQRLVKQNHHKTLTFLNDNGAGCPVQNERVRKAFMAAIEGELAGTTVSSPTDIRAKGLYGAVKNYEPQDVRIMRQMEKIQGMIEIPAVFDSLGGLGLNGREFDALDRLGVLEEKKARFDDFTQKCNAIKTKFLESIRSKLLGEGVGTEKLSRQGDIARILDKVDQFKVAYQTLTQMNVLEVDDALLKSLANLAEDPKKNLVSSLSRLTLAIEDVDKQITIEQKHMDEDESFMSADSFVSGTFSVKHSFDGRKIVSREEYRNYEGVAKSIVIGDSASELHEQIRESAMLTPKQYDNFIKRHARKLEQQVLRFLLKHDMSLPEDERYVKIAAGGKRATLNFKSKPIVDFIAALLKAEAHAVSRAQENKREIEFSHFVNGDWLGGSE